MCHCDYILTAIEEPDKRQIIEVLARNDIEAFYHFTDIEHLPSIAREDALKSKQYLEESDLLDKLRTGGNDLSKALDLHWGNWDKVSLSFCPRLPMVWYREQEQHLCYFVIKSIVAVQDGVVFTDSIATKNGQARDAGLAGLELVHFDAIQAEYPYTPETKNYKQAEILVPDEVRLRDVEAIAFRSQSSFDEASQLCADYPGLCAKFEVHKELFIAPSAYCVDHRLTALEVTQENVDQISIPHQDIFPPGSNATSLVEVQSSVGTSERFEWYRAGDPNPVRSVSSSSLGSGPFFSWNTLELEGLQAGQYEVQYLLTGRKGLVRQFTLPFHLQ